MFSLQCEELGMTLWTLGTGPSSRRAMFVGACCALFLVWGCGDDDTPAPDAGHHDANEPDADDACGGSCDDGNYCNGDEVCDPRDDNANENGCVSPGRVCDDHIACTVDVCSEEAQQCQSSAPDNDEDGHRDATCLDTSGEPLGDDCDDDSADRFSGNIELCDAHNIDEDCDDTTFGAKDEDGDGAVDALCCNITAGGERRCGLDCDDTDFSRHRRQPEFCDSKDNDCDNVVDDNPGSIPWYIDNDGDGFGDASDSMPSCVPLDGRSWLATDCKDDVASTHPAAAEACDTLDNDCDSAIDEGLSGCASTGEPTPPRVNPCLNGLDDCHPLATCTAEAGAFNFTFSCTCADGLSGDGHGTTGCSDDADECAIDNGGCDPLVTCTDHSGADPTCGACPVGYVGSGATGCAPRLTGLTLSAGTLSPMFEGTVTGYTTTVGIATATLLVTAAVPSGATLTINSQSVDSGTPWRSPVLDLGANTIVIEVQRSGFPDHSYALTVTRGTGTQQAYIKASNAEAEDRFGESIAIDGDTLVVGAYGEDSSASGQGGNQADNSVTDAGAVYVFTRSGTTWSQEAYLKPPFPVANLTFGSNVALDGNTLVVAALGDGSGATGVNNEEFLQPEPFSGMVFVFTRSGTTWTQQAFIKASNTETYDNFGHSIAIDGDTLAVSAPQEDSAITGGIDQTNNDAANSGAVYVFTRSGTTWAQQAFVKAPTAATGDNFGQSVAVAGDTLVVGANMEASGAGAVHVFTRTGNAWSPQARLQASNAAANDNFGRRVDIAGDTIVAGAYLEASASSGINADESDDSAPNSGAAYVFTRSGVTWTQQAYLKASNGGPTLFFGGSVAIEGDLIVIGAPVESNSATGINGNQNAGTITYSGAAYVFGRVGTTWSQYAYIKASNPGVQDSFGAAVALSSDTIVVGAYAEASAGQGVNANQNDDSADRAGAVYVFR